jgi:N-acetylglucosamine kinase-like BadF-type ATPase
MLLGVDAGGTSTRAVLVDGTGRCVGYGLAGGGNPVSWGPERATAQIVAAVTGATEAAHYPGPIEVAVLAMAGGSAFSASDMLGRALVPLGVGGPVEFAPDLLATFCSGTAELDGYALVAGTGAAAVRVRGGRVDASADGLGWLLGDEGSGFWIGHRAVVAALAGLDGRGPVTALTELVLAELGIADRLEPDVNGRPAALQASVDLLYGWRPVELSRFAAAAFRAALVGDEPAGRTQSGDVSSGAGAGAGTDAPSATGHGAIPGVGARPEPAAISDPVAPANPAARPDAVVFPDAAGRPDELVLPDPVAMDILSEARHLLVGAVRAVRADDVVGPVVVGGGVARRLPGLAAALARDEPTSSADRGGPGGPVVTVTDGAVGAAVLALRHADITVDSAVFDRLTASVAQLR